MHGVGRRHRARGANPKRAFGFGDSGQPNSDPLGKFLTEIFHIPDQTSSKPAQTQEAPQSSAQPVKKSSSVPPKVVSSSKASSSTSSSSSTSASPTPTPSSATSVSPTVVERTTTLYVEAPGNAIAPSASPVPDTPKSFLQNTPLSATVFVLVALVGIALIVIIITMSRRARRKAREEMEINDALSSMMVADDFDDDGSHDSSHIHRPQPSAFTFCTDASLGHRAAQPSTFSAMTNTSAGHAGWGAFGRGQSHLPDMPKPAHSIHYAETGPLMSQKAFAAATFNPSLFPTDAVDPVYNPAKRTVTPSIMTTDTTQYVQANTPLTPPSRFGTIPPSPTGSTFTLGVPTDSRLTRRGSLLDNNNPDITKSTERSETPLYFLNPTRGSDIPPSPTPLPAKFGHDDDEQEDIDIYGGLEHGDLPPFEFSRSLKVANE